MRLFVAVWPPPDVLDAVEALERPSWPGVRWTTRDQWHVTLRFLGRVDDAHPTLAALEGLHLPWASVASAGPSTRRLGRAILVLPVDGLDEVAGAVTAATASLGQPPADRPFHGHLTLARGKGGAGLGGRAAELVGVPLAATWLAAEVTLVASELHPQGARYRIIARFPLG